MAKKQGAISTEDRKFILEHIDKLSAEEMAAHLGRNIAVINKEIKNYVSLPDAGNRTIRWHLKQISEWKHIKQQFSPEELNLIEDKYVKYIEQMKDDITATEEAQVLNMIKLEILMDRNLKSRMASFNAIQNYEQIKTTLLEKVNHEWALLSKEEIKQIEDAENYITSIRNSDISKNSQYIELQKQLNDLHTKLKTSRDQRVGKVLDARYSFTAYVKTLLERDRQEKDSRLIQLTSMAVKKEESRLSEPHKFEDGNYDYPVLTAETLNSLDLRDKKEEEKKSEDIKEESNE